MRVLVALLAVVLSACAGGESVPIMRGTGPARVAAAPTPPTPPATEAAERRVAEPPARFTVTDCGSVVDRESGLEWRVRSGGPVGYRTTHGEGFVDNYDPAAPCGRGWNEVPTAAEVATLRTPIGRAPDRLNPGYGADGAALAVWTDSSFVDSDDNVIEPDEVYRGVADVGAGTVRLVPREGGRAHQLAVRPHFTRADSAATPPRFADYPARPTYAGASAPTVIRTEGERLMRTRLREIGAGPTALGGRYAFGCWGMGTSTLGCAAVDRQTGAVSFFPASVYMGRDARQNSPGFKGVEVRPGSRLVVARGLLNERYPNADHYFEIVDGEFRPVATVPKPLIVW